MKIDSIIIDNFRGIKHLEIPVLDKSINLFVGINGAGKSTLLDAISYVLSWFLARVKNPKSPGSVIAEQDINNDSKEGCQISIKVHDAGTWTLHRTKSYSKASFGKTDLHLMMEFVNRIHTRLTEEGTIPVIMYYPVDRAIHSTPAHLKRNKKASEVWDSYENALKGNADFRSFFEWYRRREDDENEHIRDNRNYEDPELKVIRLAIQEFFPDFENLRVRRNPQRFVIFKSGVSIEFNQLSQGEKCYLALVCDLARRFAIANSNKENPLEGEGIVLIDEVDLHLHPKWQMELVGKLQHTFPNCQFFLSTHSPHVLSELEAEQIFLLDNGQLENPVFNPYGKLVNEVLANYFSISMPRNPSVSKLIDEAYIALGKADKVTFIEIFRKLSKILSKADPDMVRLMIQSNRSLK